MALNSLMLAEGDVSVVSKEALAILYFLVPGLIAAWVFYGLTAHKKEDKFERVVQALIFTVVIKVAVSGVHKVWWMWLKQTWWPLHDNNGFWTDEKEVFWSVVVAVVLGVGFSFCANRDLLHRFLRWSKLTKRTSYPSEWYSALHRFNKGLVVLHLKSDRRLKGWADEWPDYPDRGHFIIQFPVWLTKLGKEYPMSRIERFLVPATEVEAIEFWYPDDKVEDQKERLEAEFNNLVELHNESDTDTEEPQNVRTESAVTESEPACSDNGDE